MNKTQRLHREIMGELMQHLSKNDAEYFANWLLTHYKIGEYKVDINFHSEVSAQISIKIDKIQSK